MGLADDQGNVTPVRPGSGGQNGKPKIKFVLPVPKEIANSITQFFGPTDEQLDGPWGGYANFNKGIDWASPDGSSFPVYAAADGKVIWAGPDGGWGNSVKVQIADGRIVTYNHLAKFDVKVGDTVRAGQPIGKAGNTGASTGTHLSFDIFEPDGATPVDPSEYFGVSLARDNRRGGGSSSGGSYFDTPPKVGLQQRQQLKSQRDYLFQLRDTLTKEDPGGNAAAIAELTKLITQLDQAIWEIDTYGYAGYEEWAKQALDAKIRAGDLELRKASQLFTEWLNKNTAAFQATANQLASASERNKAIDESLANYGKTRMALPRVYTVSPTFDEAYERWKKEFNVGSPPTLTEAVNTNIDVPMPSQPSWAGQGDVFTPEQVTDMSKSPSYQQLWDKWRQIDYGELAKLEDKNKTNEPQNAAKPKQTVDIYDNLGSRLGWGLLHWAGKKAKDWWEWSGDYKDKTPQTSSEFENWYKANNALQSPSRDRSYVDPVGRIWVYDKKSKQWVIQGPVATPTPTPAPSRTPSPTGTPTPWRTPTPTPTPRSYAQGGKNIPGGPVVVGEEGPEHIVTPDGQVVPVGQQGPQTAIVPDGVDILPANVPPEQAYLYAKLKQLMQEDLATREARKMAEAEQRRKDPNFEQKFRDAVARAAAALLAADPPPTPQLVGQGWTYDPFYYERQLTGMGPDGMPLAQSQMQLPPDPRRQARMEQMQMEQQMQGVQV
ncbi:MAG: hypothetical protein KatS3mg015_2881 [Fimbriimonadales bacterium]|nr:MAG: hypothetical protein KatS3mg015_2881 [Fimbriimonadales bacterium]